MSDVSDLVTYDSAEQIATITINRADRMNALNEDVIQGLKAAWIELEESDDRVAILHAAGDKAFSVGADIKDRWFGTDDARKHPSNEPRLAVPLLAVQNA